jgi:hypothetical protein
MIGENKRNENKLGAVDIGKLFFAILVCGSHCRFMTDSAVVRCLDSFSLPFFFTASGFLLSFKMKGRYYDTDNLMRIRASLIQMTRRYVVWTIIAIPIIVCNIFEHDESVTIAIVWFVRDLFFRGEFEWGYMCTWFILSSIYALLIVYFTMKFTQSEKILIFIAITFALLRFLICLIPVWGRTIDQALREGTIVKYLFDNTVRFHDARLLYGVYMYPVGMIIAKTGFPYRMRLIPWLLVVPYILIANLNIIPFTIENMVGGALAFICLYCIKLDSGLICRACRRISTIIFFTHMFFIYIFQKIQGLSFQDVFNTTHYGTRVFAFTLTCSVSLGVIIDVLCEKKKCQKLTSILL